MSLSDLAAIGSLVSGLAVLISLVLLYVQQRQMSEQIRQTDRNQRATNEVQHHLASSDFTLRLVEPHLASVQAKLFSADPNLSEEELFQAMNLVHTQLGMLDNALTLRRFSLLDAASLEARRGPVRLLFSQASVRAIWPLLKQNMTREVQDYIHDLIAAEPPRPSVDFISVFRANLSRIRASHEPGDGAAEPH